MATLATLVVKLVGDTAAFSSAMDGASSKMAAVGDKMAGVGRGLTAGVSLPLIAAGGAVTHFANQYNEGMANVASLGEDAQAHVAEWKPLVQDIAIATGKSTGDMSEGLYNVVSAFGATDDSIGVLDINARAAAAGLATTTDAINLTSAVTKGYGDTSSAAVQQVADLALTTVQLGQTTFPELAASIGSVTPLAASLGVAQEELFAVMATGTGVTGNASAVSTQLRGVLQGLMAPTGDMASLISDMGYESGQAMLESEGLQGTINAVVGAAEATGTPLQKYLGSIEAQTLAMALAGPQADVFTDKLAAMADVSGATDAAFAAQTEGVNAVGFGMEQAKIKMQVFAERMGDTLLPVLAEMMTAAEPVIAFVQGLADKFIALDPSQQRMILGLVAVAAAIGPVLMVLGPMVSGIGALVSVIGFLMSPIGLVIAAVALLALAWATNFGGIQDKTAAFVDWIMPYVGVFLEWLGVAWETAVLFIQQVVGAALAFIQAWWQTHGESVMVIVNALWTFVKTIVEQNIMAVQLIIQTVLAVVMAIWDAHGVAIMAVLGALWDWIVLTVQTAIDIVSGIIEAVSAAIQGDWEGFGEAMRDVWDALWLWIVETIETQVEIVLTLFSSVVANILDIFNSTDWAAVGQGIIDGIAGAISSGAGAIADAARNAASAALAAAKGFLGINSPSTVAAKLIGTPFIQGIAEGLKDVKPLTAAMGDAMSAGLIAPGSQYAMAGGGDVNRNVNIGSVNLPGVQNSGGFLDGVERLRRGG